MSEEQNIPEESHEEKEVNENTESTQTKNMEVHKHPHDITHKKKWTEYFFEFLMLFLAITAGFFVENIREHYVENKRAKEYAQLLVNDVTADANMLSRVTKAYRDIYRGLDTLKQLLGRSDIKKIPGGTLHYYGRYTTDGRIVTFNEATLNQLKNSGSLRYFHDTAIIRLITRYDLVVQRTYRLEEYRNRSSSEAEKLYRRIFDTDYEYSAENTLQIEPFKQKNYPLKTYDPLLLNEFKNWIKAKMQFIDLVLNRYYKDPLDNGRELIIALKKKYHLE